MREYNSAEEFRRETLQNPLEFSFYSDIQKKTYESLKMIINENIISIPPISRRFSMVIYGSPAIGKSFIMNYVLKDLEREGKITSNEYFYYDNFRDVITKEHNRLLYKSYNIKTINSLIESRLKEFLYEKDLKLVIFDNLKEKEFLDIDFSASNYKFNSNGKGVIWILSFKEGFKLKSCQPNIEFLEIPDITRMELQILKDRHFRNSISKLNFKIRNINDLLKRI